MEWILYVLLLFGSLQTSAEEHVRLEALKVELARQAAIEREAALYEDDVRQAVLEADWTIMPETASVGDVVLVRALAPGSVELGSRTFELHPFGGGYYAFIPIPSGTNPGVYPIGSKELTVKATRFETQYLQVTQEQQAMQTNTQRINADIRKATQIRNTTTPEFLFTEPFINPVEGGRLTTPFGFTRYVNGVYNGSHWAIDLAAPAGTPVRAANSGKVVLAEAFYLAGNSVYIDHGMNLLSQYAHLQEIWVKEGDEVQAGDIIGLVGSTGFSTGPHLHFTFWINNVAVNPDLFFDTTPFHWFSPSSSSSSSNSSPASGSS